MQLPGLEDDQTEVFDEVIESMPNTTLLLLEAEMYASNYAYRALRQARDDWSALALANVHFSFVTAPLALIGARLVRADAFSRRRTPRLSGGLT